MFIVIAYDIVDDHRRSHLARLLEDHGTRVQKSVFECFLDEKTFLDVKNQVEEEIDMEVDTVRYYFLCKRCLPSTQVSGKGTITDEEPDAVIIV